MARISSYGFDNNVTDLDAWLGTDASNRRTKQFSAEAVAKYLNIKGKISISAQMSFKFTTNTAPGVFTGPANDSAIANITTMQLSNTDASSQNVVAFVDYLVGNNILISEQNYISNFGHFTIDSYTKNGDVSTLNLTNIFGNGNLDLNKVYDFAVFTLSSPDKTFEFDQGQPATTWNIQHDLNKFPSVSVINNNNVVINGEVTYIDKNNVQINFSAGFSGKAYLN
ncbi:MAG: hypothetical protein CMJ25_01140 [Phycisphaerae bacterium]|nr:hypothetical protein [Phycisphaerae bacterium]|tara:strand:- start:28 stop:702 length:675 start_codon:yes stop_codon:yes gene_type:complete